MRVSGLASVAARSRVADELVDVGRHRDGLVAAAADLTCDLDGVQRIAA
jgi:hypothetical protein